MVDIDPFAALQRQHDLMSAARDVISEAISAIEDDRPFAARRYLIAALEGGIEKQERQNRLMQVPTTTPLDAGKEG